MTVDRNISAGVLDSPEMFIFFRLIFYYSWLIYVGTAHLVFSRAQGKACTWSLSAGAVSYSS